jgi:hypothetical protein
MCLTRLIDEAGYWMTDVPTPRVSLMERSRILSTKYAQRYGLVSGQQCVEGKKVNHDTASHPALTIEYYLTQSTLMCDSTVDCQIVI